MIKVVNRIPTTQLTWSGKTKTFTGEISDLRNFSLNQGSVTLVNPATNGTRRFNYTKTESSEGETLAWHYASADGLKLIIFND